MEPKLVAFIFGLVGVPFLGFSFLGYIGAISMADWKVTVFFVLWVVAFSLKIYFNYIEKNQKRKLTDLEIKRQERDLEIGDEIFPPQ